MKRLVADTGPLLHLHEAGALHLLPLIGEVFVPPPVLTELCTHAKNLLPDQLLGWARHQALSATAEQLSLSWKQARILHGGEAAALALANELKPDWFLTDDAAARLIAGALGIEAHGSLGVVLWAAANRLVKKTEAELFLAKLESSSLWLSTRVRAEAHAALAKLYESE
jgi:predicted nucleic acid-binding protein